MEVTQDQKRFLQEVDPKVEDTFLNGVTQSGAYLPGLPRYDTIDTNLRQSSRQGILSTFAGLIKGLGTFRPSVVTPALINGFFAWTDAAYEPLGYRVNLDGTVSLQGLVGCPADSLFKAIFVLPSELRPSKNLIFPTTCTTGVPGDLGKFSSIVVNGNGNVVLAVEVPVNGWISLSGVTFTPA